MSRNIASDEIDLLDLILIIWKKKWYFVSGIILYFFNIKIIYTADKFIKNDLQFCEISSMSEFSYS